MTGPLSFGKMKKVLNPLTKKWEFETSQGYLADAFLQVLEVFRLDPEDVYIPSFLDMSNIEFWATRSQKEQIDYVFRRYINKNCIVIGKAIVEFQGGDWYAIY